MPKLLLLSLLLPLPSQPVHFNIGRWGCAFLFLFHEMHLCLHSESKRRKNYSDLKCCGGESCTFSSLKNHPKATQSKNANFIFDSNWRYQKPKPENAWEVFWCVARRRRTERGCPWRPSFSEGSYIFQCYPSSSM